MSGENRGKVPSILEVMQKCTVCDGDGWYEAGLGGEYHYDCFICGGTGELPLPKTKVKQYRSIDDEWEQS